MLQQSLEYIEDIKEALDGDLPDEEMASWVSGLEEQLAALTEKPLQSPRVYVSAADLGAKASSIWERMKTTQSEAAFLKLLGMSPNMFRLLVETADDMHELDSYRPLASKRGPKHILSVTDVLAICVRMYLSPPVCNINETLAIFFCVSQPVIWRALNIGLPVLLRLLRTIPLSALEYPGDEDKEALLNAYKGMEGKFGKCPFHLEGIMLALMIDGTNTPACRHRIALIDDCLFSKMKGYSWNTQLIVSFLGLIVDFDPGWFGCVHDGRASRKLLARWRNKDINTLGLSLLADVGYKATSTGLEGVSSDSPSGQYMFRPSGKTQTIPELGEWVKRASNWLTKMRQMNEMVNGGIKRAYPYILKARRFEDQALLQRDWEIVCRLWNFRTRVMGFNEARTISTRHTDPVFCAALKCATAAKKDSREALNHYVSFMEKHAFDKPIPFTTDEAFDADVAACEEEYYKMVREENGGDETHLRADRLAESDEDE